MEDQKLTMTEDEFDNHLNRAMEIGKSEGLRLASDCVMEHAKRDFETFGCDNKAVKLRDLAKQLRGMSEKAHPGVPK